MTEKKRDNVIAFPHLQERLVEKAKEYLQNKRFNEALHLFKQAYEIGQEHRDVLFGLAVCYLELGEVETAKTLCKKMLHEDIGHYYDNLQMLLMILIQLGEYKEGYETLQAVIEEHDVPAEDQEQINQLLAFCLSRMNQEKDIEGQTEQEQLTRLKDFLNETVVSNQIDHLHTLPLHRMNQYSFFLQELFTNESVHPIVKTEALKILMKEQVNHDFHINKFQREKKINPLTLQQIIPSPLAIHVEKSLREKLEHENPTMFQASLEIWNRYLYVLFPFSPVNEHVGIWVEALYALATELYGEEVDAEQIALMHNFSAEDLKQAIKHLKEIEEISLI